MIGARVVGLRRMRVKVKGAMVFGGSFGTEIRQYVKILDNI